MCVCVFSVSCTAARLKPVEVMNALLHVCVRAQVARGGLMCGVVAFTGGEQVNTSRLIPLEDAAAAA